MSGYVLATIVEGHGEVDALPVLIRRMHPDLIVPRPVRIKRQRIARDEDMKRAALIAEANIKSGGGSGGVLLVLDADGDCAAKAGPALSELLGRHLSHRASRVVLAVREFEQWLVAGDPGADQSPDETRGGKGWLSQQYGRYSPTADQPRLAASMDLVRAERDSRSFRKLIKVLKEFAGETGGNVLT